jgi:lipopolysaccharide/colanic/teichoic acid biosynthesis glycosyltransferase
MTPPPIISMPTKMRINQPSHAQSWFSQILRSNRYVLGGGLLFAILIPEALHKYLAPFGVWFQSVRLSPEPSLVVATAAIVAAHLSFQRMGLLPLISAKSIILPTFLLAFGAALLSLLVIKIPIGRYHIWTAFSISLAWYFGVAVLRYRLLRPTIGLIGIKPEDMNELPENVTWQEITKPILCAKVAAVVVDPHASFDLEWSQFLTRLVLDGIPVYHRAHIEEGLSGKVYFRSHADNNFGALLPSFAYLKLKRLIDIMVAIIILPFFLLILALAALIIKFDSPGPIFFQQPRTGFRGETFLCFKLRTMQSDMGGPAYTTEDDVRITQCGRYMRKWRIDELPQIFNILKGEMSWIGPRPEAVSLATLYEQNVPFYGYRHAVLPGISGWAAVHQGNVALVDAASEKLAYDFYYIKYFSFWLDFLIALLSLRTIVSGFGSR